MSSPPSSEYPSAKLAKRSPLDVTTTLMGNACDSATRPLSTEIPAVATKGAQVGPGATVAIAVEIGDGSGVPGGVGEVHRVRGQVHVKGLEVLAISASVSGCFGKAG